MMGEVKDASNRQGGVLLHPTSLPTRFGIGDLGPAAWHWIDWLAEAGCTLWQVLPLGPTGYGDSPYQSFSAFAGNPLLISPERLVEEGLLAIDDLEQAPDFPSDRVDYASVIEYKVNLLSIAARRFRQGSATHLMAEYNAFCQEQAHWLNDFALFMALKAAHKGLPWTDWEGAIAQRQPEMLTQATMELGGAIEDQRLQQFLFFRQWEQVRCRAQEVGLKIIGDIPIFVAHDSVDVWANPELYHLDETGKPTVVAGVPPDYFSPTGQRWGNPLYRWDRMRSNGYAWWIHRLAAILSMVDLVRLDHFRGFEAYWEITAQAPTAETGRWVEGPGSDLLGAVSSALGQLPIIAEDLGVITPQVKALRDGFDLPGMRVLQFGFEDDPDHPFLPHNYPRRCVAYTGTHDNDTAKGWYESTSEPVRDFCRRYLASDEQKIAWDMVRAVWASVAERAVAPLQDLLQLGSEARMNYPSRLEGNWTWRATRDQLSPELAERMRELNLLYGRSPRGFAE